MKKMASICFLLMFLSLHAGVKPSFTFAIIGDRTGAAVSGVYESIVDEISLFSPDAVFTVGDMIEGPDYDSSSIERKWDEYFSVTEKIDAPVYYTPGNNDIFSDLSSKIYEKRVGKRYYSLDESNIHFIILDNSSVNSISQMESDQIEWLKNDLRKTVASKYIIVFLHNPFWASAFPDSADELHKIFKKYGVDAVFSGHWHSYFTYTADGIIYTAVGSSGGASDERAEGMKFHYTIVRASEAGLNIIPVKRGSFIKSDFAVLEDIKVIDSFIENCISIEHLSIDADKLLTNSFNVTLSNPNDFKISDTLLFNGFGNYEITPQKTAFELNSNETAEFHFSIIKTGSIFPLPECSFDFEYKTGRKISVNKTVSLERTENIYKSRMKTVIDGNFPEIEKIIPITDFSDNKNGKIKFDSTFIYMTHDNKNLYITAECSEKSMEQCRSLAFKRDGEVYFDDCIGILLNSSDNDTIIYSIYINFTNTIYDELVVLDKTGNVQNSDVSLNLDIDVESMAGKNGWIQEISIPLDSIGINPKKNSFMRINIWRNHTLSGTIGALSAPLFYDPKTYTIFRFK